jgi:hypothetical protein
MSLALLFYSLILTTQLQAAEILIPDSIIQMRNKMMKETKDTAIASALLIQKAYQKKNAKVSDVKKLKQIEQDLIKLSKMADEISKN